MYSLLVEQELCLRAVSNDGYGCIYAKHGAWIGATNGQFKFDYVLLGPGQNSMVSKFGGQLLRKFSGENLRLVKVTSAAGCNLLFADRGRHVYLVDVSNGGSVKVESENLLAFTDACKYSVGLLTSGMVSQKGMATSVLTGTGQGAYVAVVCDGNPIIMQTPCKVDPDAMVCFTGPDPRIEVNLGWKHMIGKGHGESYYLDFQQPGGCVLLQPAERESSLTLLDGGGQAQYNQKDITGTVAAATSAAGLVAATTKGLANRRR